MNSKLFIVFGLILLLVLAGCTTDAEKTAKKKKVEKKSSSPSQPPPQSSEPQQRQLVRNTCRELTGGAVEVGHVYSDGSSDSSVRSPDCYNGQRVTYTCRGDNSVGTPTPCQTDQVCSNGQCVSSGDSTSTDTSST